VEAAPPLQAEVKKEAPHRPAEPATSENPTKPSVWRAQKPAKRPSWLQVNEPRRAQSMPEPVATAPETVPAEQPAAVASFTKEEPATAEAPISKEKAPEPKPAATGLLDRLRQEFAEESGKKRESQAKKEPNRLGGFLDRFRQASTEQAKAAKDEAKPNASERPKSKGVNMAALSPNDLRSYLTKRIATSDEAPAMPPKPKIGAGAVGPVLRSLDAVLDQILDSTTGGLPRALLVAGTSPKADATQAAIGLARALVDRNEQVVLVDLAKGASAVSGPLGMPRVPGFTDLTAGRVSFGDVIRVDDDTPLQVITAGNPALRGSDPEPDCFMRVFEALTQAYGCVVLHADLAAINALMPALKFELPAMVAVLPPRGRVESEDEALFSFQALGCPIVVYEGGGKLRRVSLFNRSAAL
jgi:Mrp family chromosome partitioning ATPase